MIKAKRYFLSVIMAVFAVMVAWLAVAPQPVQASAATCSNGTQTRVITVVTQANWWLPGSESITLQQTQGTVPKGVKAQWEYTFSGKVGKTKKSYARWKISYKSTDNKHSGSKTLTGKNVTINLKPNKTYKITVEWDNVGNFGESFIKYPTWKVSKTYKVSKYY